MKKLLMLVVMLAVAVVAMAQSNKISYQAVVRDANNRLVASSTVDSVTVTIGTYSQKFLNVQTNQNGLMSLLIGGNTEFDAIDWTAVTNIKTVIGIGTTILTNEVPVTAVPFAMYASDVNPAGGTVAKIYQKIKADSTTVFDTLHVYYYTKAQVDQNIDTVKGNIRTEIAAVNDKLADTLKSYYTKTQVDTAKASIRGEIATVDAKFADYYTKAQVDDRLADTLQKYYTKTDVDAKLDLKLDKTALDTLASDNELAAVEAKIVNADWNETDAAKKSFIKNKPSIKDTIKDNVCNATLTFKKGSETKTYNALETGATCEDITIDLNDSLTTQMIVKYINAARADADVNDVDSIYNALTAPANEDVKKALLAKAKQVAMNHEQEAIDIAISYFKNITSTQMREILDQVSAADVQNFINKLNSVLTSTDVQNLITALSNSITTTQVDYLINALNSSVTPAQVNHLIDAIDNAAATPGTAAYQLKKRLHDYIYSVAHE